MKRLVVYTIADGNSFINIPCDRLESDANYLYGFIDNQLVAMFSIGTFDCAYLNEKVEAKV